MDKIRRKILLEELRTRDEGLLFGTIVADFIFMKVPLTQTLDDMGMFIDLPFLKSGNQCVQLVAIPQIHNITCFQGNSAPAEGNITAIVNGGTAPYTYYWSDGQTSQTAINLVPNTYTVTVTDANGCTVDMTATVIASEGADPNVMVTSSNGLLNPIGNYTYDPLPDEVVNNPILLCNGQTVTFTADGGFLNYVWQNENGDVIGNMPNLTIDTSGTYTLSVVNADGCVGESIPVTVEYIESIPPVIVMTNLPSPVIGSGTETDPYIICDPHNTTQGFPTFDLLNPELYDFIKWELATVAGTPSATVSDSYSCPVSQLCYQTVLTSSVCDAGVNTQNLLNGNTIWFAYDNNASGLWCILQGQEPEPEAG